MFKSIIIILSISTLFVGLSFQIDNAGDCLNVVYLPRHNVFFGTQIPVYTLPLCYDSCLNDSTCIALNWDYGNPGCFLFTQFETDTTDNPTVDQYSFLRDQSYCQDSNKNYTWMPKLDSTWQGVSEAVASKQLVNCVELCLLNDSCSGVSWFSNNSLCLLGYGRGQVINSSDSMHYSRPHFVPPPENTNSPLVSPWALKTEYIVIIAVGLGAILLTIIAIALLCKYHVKRPDKDTQKGFIYDGTDASTHGSVEIVINPDETPPSAQDTTPSAHDTLSSSGKPEANVATYRSIDYKTSREASTVETLHENDQIF